MKIMEQLKNMGLSAVKDINSSAINIVELNSGAIKCVLTGDELAGLKTPESIIDLVNIKINREL